MRAAANTPVTRLGNRPGGCYNPHVLDFRMLGPLEVLADGQPVSLPRKKQRALLALLLLRAGEVVLHR